MGGSGGGGYSPPRGGGSGGGGTGGGGTGGGGGGPPKGDPCDLVFQATIHSPNTDYTGELNIAAVLAVKLGGPNGRTIEVSTNQGYLIGSLIGVAQAAQLIDCILSGNLYIAEVTNISGGVFTVLVKRATS
jgi:hypothetical protein